MEILLMEMVVFLIAHELNQVGSEEKDPQPQEIIVIYELLDFIKIIQ